MLKIRKAKEEDIPGVCRLYNELLDEMGPDNPQRWTKGVYPNDDFVKETVRNETMHIGIYNNEIVSAVVLNNTFTKGYECVPWDIDATDNEVISVHTLCVKVSETGKGFGTQMAKYIVDFARDNGYKAVRLDVIDGNMNANRLYQRAGYKSLGVHKLHYDSTDCTDFTMYEFVV